MNRRKKTLFNLKHRLEKIVGYLTCYTMRVKDRDPSDLDGTVHCVCSVSFQLDAVVCGLICSIIYLQL